MDPLQNLYYALGEIAYAIARADGKIQKEEKKLLNGIMNSALNKHKNFDISDIIFEILEKENTDVETAYRWAIKEMEANRHYLSPELKATFIAVVKKIAAVFPPVTIEEQNIADRFIADVGKLKGDPDFWVHTKT